MSFQYNYSLSGDFIDGKLNEAQLNTELLAETDFIGVVVLDIGRSGDDVRIIVDTDLSTQQIATLNSVIANHVAIFDQNNKGVLMACILPKTEKYNNSTYIRCGSISYEGSTNTIITSFQIVGYIDPQADDFSFRVYDSVNRTIIASGTYVNTTEDVCLLSEIDNLPENPTIFEFQIKRTASKNKYYVYLDSITIYGYGV